MKQNGLDQKSGILRGENVAGVLRKVPFKGYKHPQYFPTARKIARKLSGKSMEKKVWAEIEKKYDSLGKEKGHHHPVWYYLNNFILHVIGVGGAYRKNSIVKENWNVPHKKILVNLSEGKERVFPDKGHSKVFLRQTPREFYETVDRALKETNADVAEIKRQIASRNADYIKVNQMLLPAYIRLRELGYNHLELIG